jgi:hypothetical protein
MNRLTLTKEARQTLSAARLDLERRIREAKATIHKPMHTTPGWHEAQSALIQLKREATLIYTALAANRCRFHCKTSEARIEALLRKASSEVMLKYLSPTEKLVLELFKASAEAAPAPAPVAA